MHNNNNNNIKKYFQCITLVLNKRGIKMPGQAPEKFGAFFWDAYILFAQKKRLHILFILLLVKINEGDGAIYYEKSEIMTYILEKLYNKLNTMAEKYWIKYKIR